MSKVHHGTQLPFTPHEVLPGICIEPLKRDIYIYMYKHARRKSLSICYIYIYIYIYIISNHINLFLCTCLLRDLTTCKCIWRCSQDPRCNQWIIRGEHVIMLLLHQSSLKQHLLQDPKQNVLSNSPVLHCLSS